MNLVVTCTVDCTSHHLTKDVYFLSEIWNLKQIKDLENRKCCSICLFERCFSFLWKNITTWLYVTLTGYVTIRHILGKIQSLRSEQKRIVLVFDDFVSKLLLPTWCYVFLLKRILVEQVNSAVLMNLVVTCTADCTSHHLTKDVYFLSEIWNLKQIKDLANRKCCSISLFERCFSFLSKKYHSVVIYHSDGTYNHPKYFWKNERLRSELKHILLVINDITSSMMLWFFC